MAEQAAETELSAPAGAAASYSPNAIHTLRTMQLSTLALSQMADQKASMLMGASFVVFSLAVGRTLAGEVAWPLAILALFAFLSALCAAIAVMPTIGRIARRRTGSSSAISGTATRRSGPARCSPSCTTTSGCSG